MEGKTIVLTGGTSGIGEVAAVQLAGLGARLVLVARDRARGEATLAKLERKSRHRTHGSLCRSLARLGDEAHRGRDRRDRAEASICSDQQCRCHVRNTADNE